jgi:dolichol-phosphate mannosyltransferase
MTHPPPHADAPAELLAVLPTYNEAGNVVAMLERLLALAPCQVLVIDDGSPDGTADLADAVGRRTGRVTVVRRARKLGLGTAYLLGFRQAVARGHRRVLQMDCDFSHDPDDVRRLMTAMDETGADLVIGSRYVSGGRITGWPLHRLLLSRGGNAYARVLLGRSIRDWTAGFKLWRLEALTEVVSEPADFADGYSFLAETTLRALRLGKHVVELPITFRERVAGDSKMGLDIVAESARRVFKLRGRGTRAR